LALYGLVVNKSFIIVPSAVSPVRASGSPDQAA